MSDIYTEKDVNIKAYVDGQPADGEFKRVKTYAPRYRWLPRFFMRWPRFVVEGETQFYELNSVPPKDTLVTFMYEIDGWEIPAYEFSADAFRSE